MRTEWRPEEECQGVSAVVGLLTEAKSHRLMPYTMKEPRAGCCESTGRVQVMIRGIVSLSVKFRILIIGTAWSC